MSGAVEWLVQSASQRYNAAMRYADKRVSSWPLMSSPWPTVAALSGYLLFVANAKSLQRFLPPLSLRPLLVVYNLSMCLLSAYMFWELLAGSLAAGYNYACQGMAESGNAEAELRIASAIWWYFASKLIEFLDTGFFVVRGRLRQVTFLHVYHHVSMAALWWLGASFLPGGTAVTGPILNCVVHVLMYGYYAASAAFPKADFWWKRYITTAQLVQFTIVILLTAYGLLDLSCDFIVWPRVALIVYMATFLGLFGRFFLHSYPTKKKENGASGHAASNGHSNSTKKPEGKENGVTVANGQASEVSNGKMKAA